MKNTKKNVVILIAAIISLVLLVAFDQWTKCWAVQNLKGQADIPIIDNILIFHYLENVGAAFGLLKNKGWLFIVVTFMFLFFGGYIFIKTPKTKRHTPLLVIVVFLLSGAIGNLIDRMSNAYVIDFIYFKPINFPVFNVADIYVTTSAIVLILLIAFFYKDADLSFLNGRNESIVEDDMNIASDESGDIKKENSKDEEIKDVKNDELVDDLETKKK